MSIVSTGYSTFLKAKSMWNSKIISVITLFITIFIMLGTMNSYATTLEDYANTKYDSKASYGSVDAFTGATSEDNQGSIAKLGGSLPLYANLEAVMFAIAPSLSTQYDSIVQNPKISPMAKLGVLGTLDKGVLAMYQNPPEVNMARHFAKEWVPGANTESYATYAAEDGYSFLTSIGVDSLWEKARLLAYVIFVVVLIAAGFMIMFRQKIGGQLAITVYNTLPNVIFGLIMVTFSFAIVGLMLNLGVLLINVIGSFLDPSGADLISVNNPFSLVGILFKPSALGTSAKIGLAALAPILVGAVVAIISTAGTAAIVGAIATVIIILIVLGLLVYASVKVYITLLTAYLGIIIDTIMGPLYLVLAAIPGQSGVGQDWFKRVLRNALVFPVVFLFLNLGMFLLKNDISLGFPSGLTGGSFANADTDGSAVGALIKAALTLVCFFLAAEAPKFLSDFIQTGGGKGTAEALGGVQKSFSKIPIIGGFFG